MNDDDDQGVRTEDMQAMAVAIVTAVLTIMFWVVLLGWMGVS